MSDLEVEIDEALATWSDGPLTELLRRARCALSQQDEQYPPCDFCGVIPDHHPWHGSGLFNGVDSPHIHACNGCRHLLPVNPAQTAPSCDHRFMYFGDQTKRRCADCYVVEGNEQTAPQPEQGVLLEAVKEAVEYLDANKLNQISSGSILHVKLSAALSAQQGDKSC